MQSLPPKAGGGLVQLRKRTWVPFSQVWLHFDQAPHSVKLPSTTKYRKQMIKHFMRIFFYFPVRHCLVKINNLLMVSVWPSSFDCKREVAKRKGQSDFVAFCRMSSDLDGAYKSVNIIYKECVQIISNLTSCITWTRRFQAFSSLQSVTNAVLATVGRWRFGAAPKASLYSFSTSHRATTPNLPLGKVAIN